MTTEAEFKFFNDRMAELKSKFSMPAGRLILEGEPEPHNDGKRNLAEVVDEKELRDLNRYSHTTFGSAKHNGKRVGLQLSWTL